MTKLEQALIDSGEAKNEAQANRIVKLMLNRVADEDENPEDVLFEYGLDSSFESDIKNWVKYQPSTPSKGEETMMVKIKALIDKANSTDSQAEKDAFMMKAQELIHKNGLEMSRVMAVKGGRNNTGFMEENIIESRIKYEESWDRELMKDVAKGNMCDIIYNSSESQIYVIGLESNVKSVEMLIDFYKKAILNLAVEDAKRKKRLQMVLAGKDLQKKLIRINKEEKDNINDYLAGAVAGLNDALNKKEELFMSEDFGTNESTGLMITGRSIITANKDRIGDYIRRTYPNLGYFRGGGMGGNSDSHSYGKGYADGGGLGAGQKRLG